MRYVLLLRGINVGKARRAAMGDLRQTLTGLGHGGVRTHLQSGNALFTSDEPDTGALEREIGAALAVRFGFDIPCLVRTQDELRRVVAADPFGATADNPARYTVCFLSAPPDAGWAASVDRAAYHPEQFQVGQREIYAWLPGGIQDSRLARELSDRRLGVTVTARNWNTVTALAALA
ncbi:MAG TPA: DUF1697 domain-containing protein [Rugosimonospora sp.]|nr:DUF1697 domain-containing protein [Rugosimonospora sp.]